MAKRVNKRFLIILTLTVMGLLGAAVVGTTLLAQGNVEEYIAQGDECLDRYRAAMARPDSKVDERLDLLKRAKETYEKALRKQSHNTDLLMKFAQVLHELVRYDLTLMERDVRVWQSVLEINPRHPEALKQMLEAALDRVELQPNAEAYNWLEQRAKALVRADESDLRGKAYEHIATLGAWIVGKAMPEQAVDAQIAGLRELMKRLPNESEIPAYLARAYLRRAQDRVAENNQEEAAKARQSAKDVFEEALQTQAENPLILFQYYRILSRLDRENLLDDKERQRMEQVLEKAASLIKPEQRDYVTIRLAKTDLLNRRGQYDESERELQELLKQRDYDEQVRLALASLWRTQRKGQQAIELLARPLGDDPSFVGYRAFLSRGLEMRRIVELANLRLESYETASEAERPALRTLVEDGYRQGADAFSAEHPALLALRGKMLLAFQSDQKSRYEAVHLLQKAYDKLEQQGAADGELTFRLALAYQSVNQSGQAKALLAKLAERSPKATVARKLLVNLLLRDREFQQADPHVKVLEQLAPDQDVLRFRILILNNSGKQEQAKQLVANLSETSDREKLLKAQMALGVQDADTAQRLLASLSEAELKQGAKELPASELLARTLIQAKKTQQAEQLIRQALEKNPQDPTWSYLLKLAQGGATVSDVIALNAAAVDEIENPVDRALQKHRLLLMRDQREEAMTTLLDAEKQAANDGHLLEAIFELATDMQDWTRAQQYTDKLAKLNWDQAGGIYYQARLKLARRDADGALRGAEELARRIPELARTWLLLGQAQQASGQIDAAITSYTKVLERQSDNALALRGLVECHWRMGQMNQAKLYIAYGMKLPNARPYFAQLNRNVQDYDKRIKELADPASMTAVREQDLQTDGESVGTWLALADNYIRVADVLQARNNKPGAEEMLAKAKSRLNEALMKWPDEPQLYNQLATLALRDGKPEEGLALLARLQAREKWKDAPEPLTLLANFQQRLGAEGIAQAEQTLRLAIAKSKDSEAMRQRLVEFFIQTQQQPKAIIVLTDMLRRNNEPELRWQLVNLQVSIGRHADAEQSLNDALKASPNDAALLALLGFVKACQGDPTAAENLYTRAIKADPKYGPARYYLGMQKMTRGDLTGAVESLQIARDLKPSDLDIRSGLAEAYSLKQQPDDAARELETAVRINPLNLKVRGRLMQFYMDERRWVALERLLEDSKGNPELSGDPRWWQVEAQMWIVRNDLNKALAAIDAARNISPTWNVYNTLFDLLLRLNRHEQLLRETDTLLATVGANRPWWLHQYRALALKNLNRIDDAVREFDLGFAQIDAAGDDSAASTLAQSMAQTIGRQTVLEHLAVRKDLRWTIAMAAVHNYAMDWPAAIKLIDPLLEGDLDRLTPQQQLNALLLGGMVHQGGGDPNKAQSCYIRFLDMARKASLSLGPQLEAMNNLAHLVAEHPTAPNPEKALFYSQKAYELMTQANQFDPGVADTHGWMLVLCNRLDEGIEYLRLAAAKDVPDAHYHLGEAYLKKSRPEDAEACFLRAQALVKEYREKQRFVDPSLSGKIDSALNKLKQPKPAANAAGA